MPTSITGKRGTWNQTVGVKLDIDDAIVIQDPADVPLLNGISDEGTNQIKVEWLEEGLTPQSITVVSFTGTGPWVLTVSATDVNYARVNDIFWKENAASAVQYLVTAIDTTLNTVTVSGFAGNAVAPVNADVLTIVGQYRVEGGDPEEQRSVERTTNFNYTEIFQERVEATRTARKRGLYGQGDPYDHELQKKFTELRIRWERSAIHGQRAISGNSQQRSMGGLFYYITTNTVSNTKANAKTAINSLMALAYAVESPADWLMVSPAVKQAIDENVDAALRRSDRTDRTGGYVIDRFMSSYGEIDITVNRFLPRTKAILIKRPYVKRRVFSPAFHELLAKTGDSDKGEIVEESSLEVKNQQSMGILTITDA